jgi:hypothetical protein
MAFTPGVHGSQSDSPKFRHRPTIRADRRPGATEPEAAGWTYVLIRFPPKCRQWPLAEELNRLLAMSRLVVGIPQVLGVASYLCELQRALNQQRSPDRADSQP